MSEEKDVIGQGGNGESMSSLEVALGGGEQEKQVVRQNVTCHLFVSCHISTAGTRLGQRGKRGEARALHSHPLSPPSLSFDRKAPSLVDAARQAEQRKAKQSKAKQEPHTFPPMLQARYRALGGLMDPRHVNRPNQYQIRSGHRAVWCFWLSHANVMQTPFCLLQATGSGGGAEKEETKQIKR